MATPASKTDFLEWDEQDDATIVPEIDDDTEDHSRNEFQESSLKNPLGPSSTCQQTDRDKIATTKEAVVAINRNSDSDSMPQPRDVNQSVSETLRTGGISDSVIGVQQPQMTFRPLSSVDGSQQQVENSGSHIQASQI